MEQVKDGMTYAPKGKENKVVEPGEFVIAAMALDHGHIHGMCNGLTEAGATLKWVYDPDPEKVEAFLKDFPGTKVAESEEQILEDPEVQLVAAAAVTNLRAPLGIRVLDAGKHYFTDKAPLVSLEQLADVKAAVKRSGKRYFCYFSERLHVEAAVYAGQLIKEGRIGKVIQTEAVPIACVLKVVQTGSLNTKNTVVFFAILAVIRLNNSFILLVLRMRRLCQLEFKMSPIPSTPNWKTLGTVS